MAKLTTPAKTAEMLSVRERVLLFCAASRTDWLRAGVTRDMVTHMLMVGLISRDAAGAVALTERGRAVYNAMLPEPRPCSQLVPEPPERDPSHNDCPTRVLLRAAGSGRRAIDECHARGQCPREGGGEVRLAKAP